MAYIPTSPADRDYIARRMADGLTYEQACDMFDEHVSMIADDMRDSGEVDDDDE